MAKIYKSALGKQIDVDQLALTNEHIIAVGNMRVNSRGDELGAGGKVVKTRDQIMKEYYALNTPVAADPIPAPQPAPAQQLAVETQITEIPTELPNLTTADPATFNVDSGLDEIDVTDAPMPEKSVLHTAEPADASDEIQTQPTIRGSLANAVAKTATVTQVEKLPPKKARGIQRF